MARSLEERWVEASPEQMVEWFVAVSRDRMAMIRVDLAALPNEPATVVEGPQVLPELLPPGARAVFLLPTPGFRRDALAARPLTLPVSDPQRANENRLERDRILTERIRAGPRERGFPILEIDGSLDAEAVAARLADHLPPRKPSNRLLLSAVGRWENEAAAVQIRLWTGSGEGPAEAPAFPFACECGRSGCADAVELTPEEFEARAAAGPLLVTGT